MSQRFAIALAVWCAACSLAAAAEAKRPNVLFLMSDDLNNLLGCYGDRQASTPNIDRLASLGVRFDRAYCAFPLCGPSRNSILTGLYPNSTGILVNAQIFRQTIPSQVSLPQAFRQAGYFVARIGKLYHYNVPMSIGTNGHDDPGSWELELNPAGVDRLAEEPKIFSLTPGSFGGTLSWYASPQDDSRHTDGLMADDAEAIGEWLASAMEASWATAESLLDVRDLADVFGDRHRIIANDWQAALLIGLVARLLRRRHQPGTALRRRLVSLLHRRARPRRPQAEGRAPRRSRRRRRSGPRHDRGRLLPPSPPQREPAWPRPRRR